MLEESTSTQRNVCGRAATGKRARAELNRAKGRSERRVATTKGRDERTISRSSAPAQATPARTHANPMEHHLKFSNRPHKTRLARAPIPMHIELPFGNAPPRAAAASHEFLQLCQVPAADVGDPAQGPRRADQRPSRLRSGGQWHALHAGAPPAFERPFGMLALCPCGSINRQGR